MSATILLVEDNPHIMSINREALQMEGFKVVTAETVAAARTKVIERNPDLIVLDVLLPDGDGLSLCEQIRSTDNIPILFVTARGSTKDIIAGFDAGGDDYLPKPYDLDVLVMRIKSLLRRAQALPETVSHGPIQINIASGKAFINGEDIGLQQKELYLLIQLMKQPEQIITAEQLYEKVWGQKMLGQDNALKVAISKLRNKLQGTGYTVSASRGEGYYFEME